MENGIFEPSVRPNSRIGGGYSLRRSLIEQGMMDEIAINRVLTFVYNTLCVYPRLDITQYRIRSPL